MQENSVKREWTKPEVVDVLDVNKDTEFGPGFANDGTTFAS